MWQVQIFSQWSFFLRLGFIHPILDILGPQFCHAMQVDSGTSLVGSIIAPIYTCSPLRACFQFRSEIEALAFAKELRCWYIYLTNIWFMVFFLGWARCFFFFFVIFWPTWVWSGFGVFLSGKKAIVQLSHLRWSCSLAWSFAPTFLRWHRRFPAIPPSWSSQRMMTTRNWPGWRWGLVNGVDEFLEMDGRQRESKHLETVTLR